MNKSQKQELVKNLHEIIGSYAVVIVTKNINISVANVKDLRRRVKKSNGHYCVVKNKLAKIAIRSTCYEHLGHLFTGPIAITYCNDPVLISKIFVDFCAKNEGIQILGGAIYETYLTAEQIQEFALLPSIDESRTKIIGLLNMSIAKIAVLLQVSILNFVNVLAKYSKQ